MFKVGIIGCGRIAGGFEGDIGRESPCTHIGAYNLNSKTNVTAISDNSKDALLNFSTKWNINNAYLDYREMLKNEHLDIVSVCSNEDSHFQVVIDAAKSGAKLIFCEKPIAKNTTQAKEMIQCCEENQVKLVINHSRRWHNNFIYAKKQIDSAAFGKIVSITGRYTSGLRVMGTHMIDIMSFLCGPVISISGVKKEKEIKGKLKYSENFSNNDPSYSALLNFNNDIVGFLEGSCHKKYLLFELDIHFTDGRISIINNGQKIDLWRHNKGLLSQLPDVNIKLNSTIMNAVNSNIDCLEFGTETPSSGKDGFYALEIIEKILRSDLIHNKEKVWKN
jgi:predicted dehydrogenase